MVEHRLVQCKRCYTKLIATRSIRTSVDYDKKWETDGRFWNGKVCPDCHRKEMAKRNLVKKSTKASQSL